MRKITLFIMTLMMAGSLFAYEPKKENVTVKINGDVVYYEKTEPYKSLSWDKDYENCVKWVIGEGHTVEQTEPYKPFPWGEDYKDYVNWVIREDHTVEQFVDDTYYFLVCSRIEYYSDIEEAINPLPIDSEIAATELLNKMNGTNISPEEYTRSLWLEYAEGDITWAVTHLAFVTEENYLTLTKEELYEKVNDFIEEVRSENK